MNNVSKMNLALGSTECLKGPFDLVIANILAGPLKEMSGELMSLMKPGGALILSGFLKIQLADLLKAYESLGKPRQRVCSSLVADPTLEGRDEKDTWICLFWNS